MFSYRSRECNCGSGKPREELFDARNIFCAFVCEDCREAKMKKYRVDIFDDSNYWHDEPIDED